MSHRDVRSVVRIFNYYVEHSFAAYPESPVAEEPFQELRKAAHLALVAKHAGDVVGFAIMRPFHHASTFQRTAEVSYFIDPEHTGQHLGSIFLEKLIENARTLHIDWLLASVSSRNEGSLAFHRKHGFEECGHFRDIGRKNGQDFGIVWFQKRI
ncbi:MAG TPA: GNAT family N-acetyltransferase [Terriglobales bacterium]|nr:GNAT family N-acetyltransferase [Terriglobales bacterium]